MPPAAKPARRTLEDWSMLMQALLVVALQAPAMPPAAPAPAARARATQQELMDATVMGTRGYGTAHPDVRYRQLGLESLRGQRDAQARDYFRIAARYADKLSQAALADMYWTGKGGDRDPALAYAWMDLAAERGTPWLLLLREQFWAGLDATQRARAVQEGQAIYAMYADDVAKPRLERILRVTRNEVLGSHLGNVTAGLRMYDSNSLQDVAAGRAARPLTPTEYYADRYWKPAQYWAWQDQVLAGTPHDKGRIGVVDVGLPQVLDDAPPVAP